MARRWFAKYDSYILIIIVACFAASVLVTSQQDMLFAIQDLSVWSNSQEFFRDQLTRPFGLLQWTSCLLNQFFYYPLLGIAILVGIWTISALLTVYALRPNCCIAVLPILCLLVSFTEMGYWVYLAKLTSYWYLFTLLWLWWAVMLVLLFRVRKMMVKIPVVVMWLMVLQPWNGLRICPFENMDQFMYNAHYALLFVLILQLVLRLTQRWYVEKRWGRVGVNVLGCVLLVAGIVASSMLNYRNAAFHAELRMQQEAERGDWDAMINEYSALKNPTRHTLLLRDLALLHKGELSDSTQAAPDYRYPCNGTRPKMLHGPKVYMAYSGGAIIYFLAGYLNASYRWSFENAIEYGFSPQRLRMLLRCAVLNGEKELAHKYANLLRETLFHADAADAIEAQLKGLSSTEMKAAQAVRQTDEALKPEIFYAEYILLYDEKSPLNKHFRWHFDGKVPTY